MIKYSNLHQYSQMSDSCPIYDLNQWYRLVLNNELVKALIHQNKWIKPFEDLEDVKDYVETIPDKSFIFRLSTTLESCLTITVKDSDHHRKIYHLRFPLFLYNPENLYDKDNLVLIPFIHNIMEYNTIIHLYSLKPKGKKLGILRERYRLFMIDESKYFNQNSLQNVSTLNNILNVFANKNLTLYTPDNEGITADQYLQTPTSSSDSEYEFKNTNYNNWSDE